MSKHESIYKGGRNFMKAIHIQPLALKNTTSNLKLIMSNFCRSLAFITVVVLEVVNHSQSKVIPNLRVQHRTVSLNPEYDLSWSIDPFEEEITFDAKVRTKGFVGLGISPGGGMTGADIFVGGVRDGVSYLEDRHGLGNFTPLLDDEQNLHLISAVENDTHTMIRFSRRWNTCDNQDAPISEGTTNLIWSYGSTDDLNYHGANRGQLSVNLLDPIYEDEDLSRFNRWELRTRKGMPSNHTSYWCTIHKAPSDIVGKNHIVAFDAILESPQAFKHAHHMEAYSCHVPEGMEEVFESYVGAAGDDCYYPKDIQFPGHYCEAIAYGWAIGGGPVVFPEFLGFPVGRREFFKLEVHYDNPEEVDGVQFDTGLILYHTPDTRDVDAGRFVIGAEVNFTQMVPPDSIDFVSVAHCDASCTQAIPIQGVSMFNFLIHAHYSGKEIRVRQFRNGIELPWLINDANYNFNFQATRGFREEIRLMPGDHLSVECKYDSRWKVGRSTVGGRATTDEMCMAFISYYPKVDDFLACGSELPEFKMLEMFGIHQISLEHPSDTDPIVESPPNFKGMKFSTVVDLVEWEEGWKERYQNRTRWEAHLGYCRPQGRVVPTMYPAHNEDYSPPQKCPALL